MAMDVTSWSTIISQVGFPVAVACLVLLRFDKSQQKMNDMLVEALTLLRLLTRDIDIGALLGK